MSLNIDPAVFEQMSSMANLMLKQYGLEYKLVRIKLNGEHGGIEYHYELTGPTYIIEKLRQQLKQSLAEQGAEDAAQGHK